MNKFKEELGEDFSWTERNIPVKDPEADWTSPTIEVTIKPKPKPILPPAPFKPELEPVTPTPTPQPVVTPVEPEIVNTTEE